MRSERAPIAIGTPMKCGTWLIRELVSRLTGLPWREPPLVRPMRQDDPAHLLLDPEVIYSWHFVPGPEIERRLHEAGARVVFVVRNLYAMVLSMYHHFADNIDWEIGRGANQQALFAGLTRAQGISRIIAPEFCPGADCFNWDGIGRYLRQIERMLAVADANPAALLLSFEALRLEPAACVERLADHLGVGLAPERRDALVAATGFDAMRKRALADGHGSHFRRGELREYQRVLTADHRDQIETLIARETPALRERLAAAGLAHVGAWDNRCEPGLR